MDPANTGLAQLDLYQCIRYVTKKKTKRCFRWFKSSAYIVWCPPSTVYTTCSKVASNHEKRQKRVKKRMSQQVQGFCQSITGLSWPTAKPIDLIFLLTYKAATAKFR